MATIVKKGNIAECKVDVIVNTANSALSGGGGVDGAIHRGAGKELAEECRENGRCETGKAILTKGYNLPAKYVIHVVAPVWFDGNKNEEDLLKSCYQEIFRLAKKCDVKSIAIRSIGTGAYKFPLDKAVKVALDVIKQYESQFEITIICFDDKTYRAYKKKMEA